MSTLKLARYADDEARLLDVDDAEFLQRKVKPDVMLDFSGVGEISAAFLDVLLEGETAEAIADRVSGMSAAVDEALAEWVDRANQPVKPIERKRSYKPVRVTKPVKSSRHSISRPVVTDDRFTPTRLVQRLSESLRGYIESAYPLSDPILVQARRHLLETEAEGHLLAQEPFIETTTRYATSPHRYDELGLPDHIGAFFTTLSETPISASADEHILYKSMYQHQERAFTSFIAEGKDTVVATGTGSGKTECFLVPMLGSLYDEAHERPKSFEQPSVRALILYPMNALVNDQLSRLRLLFGEQAVVDQFSSLPSGRFPRFGMYTGRTPYPGPRKAGRDGERVAPLLDYYLNMDPEVEKHLRELGRYPAKDLATFYGKEEARRATYQSGKRAGQEYTRHNWDKRLHTSPGDRELITRQEMIHGVGTQPGHSPDVLVTNYSMLEYMLMRPFERPIFEETRLWLKQDDAQLLLVLDEAHMYRGAKGAEVAFLIRRLRARLGIHDQPEKLRVISTSASLGTDDDALTNITRFASDLTGKAPSDFVAISGMRKVPDATAEASSAEADLLAAVDLKELNEALSGTELKKCLEPVFKHYGVSNSSIDEATLLATLHDALLNRPMINRLITEAAGNAKALSELAEIIFPSHPKQLDALQSLLALGTLARQKPDSPGLVPTRVHAMFRGLHGLYACVNTQCEGRQAVPREQAAVGKLFSSPQTTCDSCGCRVFELASCRSCGSPYLLAYAEAGTLDSLEYLWGETEGNLVRFQLLPGTPRYTQNAEELRVHIRTGYLDRQAQFPEKEVRSIYAWVNSDGLREPNFGRCVMCQPGVRERGRIHDFRTRGEQPFTALIETQFAEQPPQKNDATLPNHGRKVLVFSDGRQKAARLAPALEHSHARDLFRQVIAMASQELRKHDSSLTGMHWLYTGTVWLCAQHGYGLSLIHI